MKERIDWVDYAKASGVVLVVYGHVARGINNAGIKIPEKLYVLADSIIYSFHMPLFFFLSGLFFYNSFSKRGGINLVSSKINTIVYPYIIWSILQGIMEASLSKYTNGNVSYSDVLTLLWSPRAQFWFLYALFIAFCVATIIYSIFSKKVTGFVFLLSAILYVYQSALSKNILIGFILDNFVFFAFGILFSFHARNEQLSNPLTVSLLASAFVIGQFLFHDTLGLHYTDKGLASLVLAILSIVFVISLSSWLSKRPSELFIYVGTSSMAIYLMHILACSGTRIFLNHLFNVDSFVIHIVIGCIMGVVGPISALVIINKLRIKYIFSAPVSSAILFMNNKASL